MPHKPGLETARWEQQASKLKADPKTQKKKKSCGKKASLSFPRRPGPLPPAPTGATTQGGDVRLQRPSATQMAFAHQSRLAPLTDDIFRHSACAFFERNTKVVARPSTPYRLKMSGICLEKQQRQRSHSSKPSARREDYTDASNSTQV